MGIFFRDKGLKETFKKAIGSDWKLDLLERIVCLINFAYKRVGIDDKSKQKEEKKKNDVGVAFIRQLWKKEGDNQQKIKDEVTNKTLLSIAKLYKIGLQANKGWFSDLPGKEIQKYALDVFIEYIRQNKMVGNNENNPYYTRLLYICNSEDEAKSKFQDVNLNSNKLDASDIKKAQKKFTEEIKNLSNSEIALSQWYTDLNKEIAKMFPSNLAHNQNIHIELNPKNNNEPIKTKKQVAKDKKNVDKNMKKAFEGENKNKQPKIDPKKEEEKQKEKENKKKNQEKAEKMNEKLIENQAKEAENKNKENPNKNDDDKFLDECVELYNSCIQTMNKKENKGKIWYKCLTKNGQKKLKEIQEKYPNKQLPGNGTVHQAWEKNYQQGKKH